MKKINVNIIFDFCKNLTYYYLLFQLTSTFIWGMRMITKNLCNGKIILKVDVLMALILMHCPQWVVWNVVLVLLAGKIDWQLFT